MSKEAIKHYEAALKEAFPRGATGEVFHHWNEARYLIATESLDKMAENARELGLDYDVKSDHRLMEQPAQQEPVAYGMFDTMLGKGNRMMMVRLDKGQDGCTVPLYTSPPAQRKPLTDEMVVAAARMLSDRQAAACNVDCGDMWKLHGNDFIEDARAALEAAHGIGEKK